MQPQGVENESDGPGPRHEPLDLSIQRIVLFAVGLGLLAVIVHVVLGFMMEGFRGREKRAMAMRPERYQDTTGQFPPPRLQDSPNEAFANLRQRSRERLDEYGWVDRKAGIARIPLERAIEILGRRETEERDASRRERDAKEAGQGEAKP